MAPNFSWVSNWHRTSWGLFRENNTNYLGGIMSLFLIIWIEAILWTVNGTLRSKETTETTRRKKLNKDLKMIHIHLDLLTNHAVSNLNLCCSVLPCPLCSQDLLPSRIIISSKNLVTEMRWKCLWRNEYKSVHLNFFLFNRRFEGWVQWWCKCIAWDADYDELYFCIKKSYSTNVWSLNNLH